MVGPWRFAFGLLPNPGGWDAPGVLAAVESYQLPFVTAPGRAGTSSTREHDEAAPVEPQAARLPTGLLIEGRGVVLSALRRRDGELELRLVAKTPTATTATISGPPIVAARDVDLLGRPGPERPVETDGSLRLELGAWEIRTIRVRRASV
jgi:alpha-mannosidase